jgi:hypothetical protein
LLSPVFYSALCGDYAEGGDRKMELEDVEEADFRRVLSLMYGQSITAFGMSDVLELARLADRSSNRARPLYVPS